MSKDMLGPIVRALVGVPEPRLGIVADLVNRLGSDQGDGWSTRFKTVLREGLATTQEEEKYFSVIATTNLGAVAGKPTQKCFTGSRWAYRDADFDNWLSANQPSADACIISTLAFAKDWTFAGAAAKVLGVDTGTDIVSFGNALIARGHTMTPAQAEEMVEATERREKTGMRVDGYGNVFFVETGDPENPVSIGYVYRVGRDWRAYVRQLDNDYRWGAGNRLLVRNLSDTLKL